MGREKTKPKQNVLDNLWSGLIKNRDGNKCVRCGKDKYLNSHHIFSRSNRSTRWVLENGITLCAGCHTLSSTFSAHKTPVEFVEWIKERNGETWYVDLRRLAATVDKSPIKEVLERLREMSKES